MSLRRNGVAAKDGGFIQSLVTTAQSMKLREIAADGSERPHDVLGDIKQTRIRYGNLGGEGLLRRFGFGVEDEVIGYR